jgi:hypothetical protein
MAMIARAVGKDFKSYLFGSLGLGKANIAGGAYALAGPVSPVVAAGTEGKEERSGEVTENPPPSTSPSRTSSSAVSASRLGCSCLLAPLALFASLFSLFFHEVVFPPTGPSKNFAQLPTGCPLKCDGIILDNYDLSGADLSRSSFAGTKMPNVVLRGANLRGANLREAYLFWDDLRDANLSEADLSGADLRRVVLLGARLEKTNLRGAYLREADLQDVDLSTADLQGADLRNASYNQRTLWPPGFDVEKAGMYLVAPR